MTRIDQIIGTTFHFAAASEGVNRIVEVWIQSEIQVSGDGRLLGGTEVKWYRVEMVDDSFIDINPLHVLTIARSEEKVEESPLESTRESA